MNAEFEMDTLQNLVSKAIKLLRLCEPQDKPYWGCFSGGKDSVVIKHLAAMAGVRVDWHFNVTTIDPPELVSFIRKQHPDVKFDRAPINFFRMCAVNRALPTRTVRFCCKELKELRTPPGETMILGVRTEESQNRSESWQVTRRDRKTNNLQLAPICGWKIGEVWEFIREHELPYCPLYDEGFERIGCIGCDMAGRKGKLRQFARWPRFEALYRKTLDDIFRKHGSDRFNTSEEWWEWWMADRHPKPEKASCNQFFDGFFQS